MVDVKQTREYSHRTETWYKCPVCGFLVDRLENLPSHLNNKDRTFRLTSGEESQLQKYLNMSDAQKLNKLEPLFKKVSMNRAKRNDLNQASRQKFEQSHTEEDKYVRDEIGRPSATASSHDASSSKTGEGLKDEGGWDSMDSKQSNATKKRKGSEEQRTSGDDDSDVVSTSASSPPKRKDARDLLKEGTYKNGYIKDGWIYNYRGPDSKPNRKMYIAKTHFW